MTISLRRWVRSLFLALGCVLLSAPAVPAGFLDLAWDAPITNSDGTPLTDLAGYRLYWGTSGGGTAPPCNTNFTSVGNVTTFRLTGLTDGTTYFVRVTASDTTGNESACSNEDSGAAQPDPGGPPPDTTRPTVSITAPANNATVSGSSVTVSANASDNVGVVGVQFRVDGANLGAEDTVAPYSVSWDTTTATNSAHTLTAVARDAAGNTTTSNGVNVTVDNGVPDTTPPTVSITAPAGNATVSGASVTVSANASDNVGVVGVQFRVDGANLGAEDTVAPYSVSWDTTAATNDDHTLTAMARDAAGNTTTSSSVNVTVDNITPTSLTVRTLSGTRIFLGGNHGYLGAFQGSVPQSGELRISGLTPGKQIIRTRAAGFLDAYRMVQLAPGENVVSIDLALFDSVDSLDPNLVALEGGGVPITGGGDASAPFVVDWDNDGNKDLLVAGGDGSLVLYRNVGSDAAPKLGSGETILAAGAVPDPAFVFVVDWDGDEKKDLIVGDGQGGVHWYRNTLTDAVPQLTDQGFINLNPQVGGTAAPVVFDWNGDGVLDLTVGSADGTVWRFLSTGTDPADGTPILVAGEEIALPGVSLTHARPFVVDWDQDGRMDLLMGYNNIQAPVGQRGEIYVFLNSGTDADPDFADGSKLSTSVNSHAAPFVVDWNNDSFRDLLIGENQGQVMLALGSSSGGGASSGGSSSGGGGGGCFIATAAYGSPLAPQVQLLRDFRDQYLLPHSAGRALVALYYRLSPPLAEVIAGSEILRALVRVALMPVLWWAALVLWSPVLGLGVLIGTLGLGAWVTRRVTQRHRWAAAGHAVPLTGHGARLVRSGPWRRLAFWACLLFVLATPALLEAGQGERPQGEARAEFAGEVRFPQATWFALVRDLETGHLALYKGDEPIHTRENPLPLGKIVAVDDKVVVLALPSGRTVELPQGTRLPGPRQLSFVRSILLDTLRFQVRYGAGASARPDYTVVEIAGRRALLERDVPSVPGGLASVGEGGRLVERVNRMPFIQVAPNTWEIPAADVKELGNHLGPMVIEALSSATPRITPGYGIALRMDTSLGSGTLDRRGFEIQVTSLARRTGLEVGDRILFVSGEPVNSLGGLISIYRGLKRDSALTEVKVVINRRNQLRTLTYRIR